MTLRKDAHGQVGTSTYYSWASMKSRCYDIESPNYKEYGGAGITVCDRWFDFKNFFNDMGERPDGCTLNRVHEANVYSKATCEWATFTVQSFDQRRKSHNTSGRTGVYWRKARNHWNVLIWKEGVAHYGGSFQSFDDAVIARSKLEERLYGFTKT